MYFPPTLWLRVFFKSFWDFPVDLNKNICYPHAISSFYEFQYFFKAELPLEKPNWHFPRILHFFMHLPTVFLIIVSTCLTSRNVKPTGILLCRHILASYLTSNLLPVVPRYQNSAKWAVIHAIVSISLSSFHIDYILIVANEILPNKA